LFKKTNDSYVFEFKTKNFIIRYSAEDSDTSFDDLTNYVDNEVDAKAFIEQIECNELIVFNAVIEVFLLVNNEEIYLSGIQAYECVYPSYKDFIDYKGLGYYASLKKIKTEKVPYLIESLKQNIEYFELNGELLFSSYFKDLVKGAISDAKKSSKYIIFKKEQDFSKKIAIF
jgi:hypothetical protein